MVRRWTAAARCQRSSPAQQVSGGSAEERASRSGPSCHCSMDRAKNRRTIQQCCLPVSLTPSAPLILAFSELTISGYPAYTCPYPTLQVRGFPPPSHGLGSGWFATPFLYDSFIHYFTPVYPDAIQATGQATGLRHPVTRSIGPQLAEDPSYR